MKNIASLLIIWFLVTPAAAQMPGWFQKLTRIKPFESSKMNVEVIFDDAKQTKSFIDKGVEWVFYDTAEGRLTVIYSAGSCSQIDQAPFELEEHKVINVSFSPQNKFVRFSEFKIKKKGLYKEKENDNPTWHYYNDESGVDYSVQRNNMMGVALYPSVKHQNKKCRASEPFRTFLYRNGNLQE